MSDAEVRQLNRKMDRVLDILNNDEGTGEKGLVAEVASLKDRVNGFIAQYNIDQAVKKREEALWRMFWGAIGTGIVFLGKALINWIFKI